MSGRLSRWRYGIRLLVGRIWYLPLPLTVLLAALVWPLSATSDLLTPLQLYPHSPGQKDFELNALFDPTLSLQGMDFSYHPGPSRMLAIRFNERAGDFDFIRLSGIDEFPSGIFSFRDGEIEPVVQCPWLGEHEKRRYSLQYASGKLAVSNDRQACQAEVATIGRPVRFLFMGEHPLVSRPPVRDLSVDLVDTRGKVHQLRDHLAWKVFFKVVGVCFLYALLISVLIFVFAGVLMPQRWLERHPHAAAFFAVAIVLLLALISFTLVWRGAKAFGVDVGGHEWYLPYMKNATIDESLLARADVIANGECEYRRDKNRPFRVVLLGGSSTFGSPFHPCAPSVWSTQLQGLFDDATPGQVEVVNLGAVGDSFSQHLERGFELALSQWQPDAVVIDCVANNWFYHQRFFSLLDMIFIRRFGKRPTSRVGIGEYRAALQRMIAAAGKSQTALVLVEEPIWIDIFHGRNPLEHYHAALAEVCAQTQTPLVRAQDEFNRRRDHFLFYDVVHLTWWGNRLLAQKIHQKLRPILPADLPQIEQ